MNIIIQAFLILYNIYKINLKDLASIKFIALQEALAIKSNTFNAVNNFREKFNCLAEEKKMRSRETDEQRLIKAQGTKELYEVSLF